MDPINRVEIRSDAYPGERLMVGRHPLLARQRTLKRREMLSKTEELLDEIVAATRRDRRWGRERITLRVGKVVNKYKMAKHFELDITEESFTCERNTESIAAEAALDGLYVIRTSLPDRGGGCRGDRAGLPQLQDRGPEGAPPRPREP